MSAPVSPAGSCPAKPDGPVPDGVQLNTLVQAAVAGGAGAGAGVGAGAGANNASSSGAAGSDASASAPAAAAAPPAASPIENAAVPADFKKRTQLLVLSLIFRHT